MKKPKILLGTPTYEGKEYCLDFWIKKVREIQKVTPCDIVIIDNSKGNRYANIIKNKYKIKVIKSKYSSQPLKSLGEARKKLFEYAIKNKYDFLFSIEQDIFPPTDIIKILLKIRKELKVEEAIIGAPYIITNITEQKSPFLTLGYLTNVAIDRVYSKKMKRKIQRSLTRKQIIRRKKIFKAYACGLGCTLVDISILKKIDTKYTEKQERPDDAFFYLQCFNQKIPVYVDPTLSDKVMHIDGNTNSIVKWGKIKNKV